MLWSDGVPDHSHNFIDSSFYHVKTCGFKETQRNKEKLVTKMKPFKFASRLRKPHLSSLMRLDVVQTRLDTRLPKSRAGGQGPYLRTLDRLDRCSKVRE